MAFLFTPSDHTAPDTVAGGSEPFYRRFLLEIVLLVIGLMFFAAPWSFETKAKAAMHGLCAQTPSHSFYFGERVLPFDGRMTGIYAGLLTTVVVLVLLGRHRAAALPTIPVGLILVLFIGTMAVDGFNSLLTDLGRWHPYTPSNEYRLITGWTAGIAIGTVLIMLVGMTFWRRPKTSERVVSEWWLPLVLLLPVLPVRLLIATESLVVFYPLAFLLMVGALLAFTTLALVTIVMLWNRENQFEHFDQLRTATAISMVIAILIIAAIGGSRFWLESVAGLPQPI